MLSNDTLPRIIACNVLLVTSETILLYTLHLVHKYQKQAVCCLNDLLVLFRVYPLCDFCRNNFRLSLLFQQTLPFGTLDRHILLDESYCSSFMVLLFISSNKLVCVAVKSRHKQFIICFVLYFLYIKKA